VFDYVRDDVIESLSEPYTYGSLLGRGISTLWPREIEGQAMARSSRSIRGSRVAASSDVATATLGK
jgi:hypothetical protein